MKTFYSFTLWAICAIGLATAQEKKPNIVLLYIDDWAWNGTSVAMHPDMPNTRMPVVQMPNLDRLASEGMKFSNAYGSPQCSPARACVLTGQTSARNGFTVYMNSRKQEYYDESKEYEGFKVVPCIANEVIAPDKNLGIPNALAPLGYSSAHIGKWHLRGDPGEHGYVLHDGDTNNDPGNTIKRFMKPNEEKPKRLTEELMTDPKLMFSITEKAIGFIEQQVKADTPFFVQISHYAMHAGSECKPATREKYINDPFVQAWYQQNDKTAETVNSKEDPAVWLGMADDMDGRIGAVLDKLDELGIADHTYVVMVADNGYRHSFLPELTQPLHAHKWWVWEGGIRVPMIVKGPGIGAGSLFRGNVVNYDLLPTFVDWAGGDPKALSDIDGVSLASYLAGREPETDFLNRNLYFHYPHYRTTMPHSAVVSGNHKVLHFWGHDEIPMLFDLSNDVGEVKNIADSNPRLHKKLHSDMMSYLDEVNGRIPKTNPNYDPEKYRAHKEYWSRVNWGPFKGERSLDDDERAPTLTLNAPAASAGDKPKIQFANIEDGAAFPAGTDLEVKLDVSDKDGIESIKLSLNGLLLNAQGKTKAPQFWSASGDHLLEAMKPGIYRLEATATDIAGKSTSKSIQINVGESAAEPKEKIVRLILKEGDKINADQAIKFPRLECVLKLGTDGKLLLRDEVTGKLFKTDSEGQKGAHHVTLETGQLKIYRGKGRNSRELIWETPPPTSAGPYQLGINSAKQLVIYNQSETVWTSH